MPDGNTPDFENMSDDDLMQMSPDTSAVPELPEDGEEEVDLSEGTLEDRMDGTIGQEPEVKEEEDKNKDPDPKEEDQAADEKSAEGETDPEDLTDEELAAAEKKKAEAPEPKKEEDPSDEGNEDPSEEEDEGKEEKPSGDGSNEEPKEETNYEKLYKDIMKPFKANGREFTPSSPEEAVRLMQMGANYTKKMQTLQPHLKMIRMLDNNGLLQEEKLSFLIDLDKKDPNAIQKLLHDGSIDPLDLDTSVEPTYKPGDHTVSDKEMAFHDGLENVLGTSTGKETVALINGNWDQESKQAIYDEPSLLAIINDQRESGIYTKITAEIDRQKTLGDLQNIPFLQAYRIAGDKLHKEGAFTPAQDPPVTGQDPVKEKNDQILATRPARPKPPAANADKAKGASPAPRTSSSSAKAPFDPTKMSDDEIMSITSLKV